MAQARWLKELQKKFGKERAAGMSKHARGKRRSKNFWAKRKAARLAAKKSRRQNRYG